ncbi:MAG: hypothetical protein QG597_1505 [Actinomycetota bacterium]|nr:hypothetical protein [Actinomycetota bacterium]
MSSQHTPPASDANWYPDPSHRHDFRYWNGSVWTSDVADSGKTSVDRVFTDPDAALIGVRHPVSRDRTGACHWRDVPHRDWWESYLAPDEVPLIVSWAGLLATDRALLVAEKWPAVHLGRYGKLGDHADRYDFADISDVDEEGFDYSGSRQALKWQRDDKAHRWADFIEKPTGFLWFLLASRPELAPKLLVQQAEMSTSPQRTVHIGHLLSGSGYNLGGGVPGTSTISVQQQFAVGTVNVVAQRDPSLHTEDYCQFVSCPECGTQLRLRIQGEKIEICNPGTREGSAGGYAMDYQVHQIDPA